MRTITYWKKGALLSLFAPLFCLAQASGGGGAAAKAFKGSYAFLLQGIAGAATSSASPRAAFIGSLIADGNGNIVSGEADVNSATLTSQRIPLTGKYTLNLNGQGTLSLNTPLGTLTLTVVTSPIQAANTVSSVTITTAPPTLLYGSGALVLENLDSVKPSGYASGVYVFNLNGEAACGSACVSGAGPAAFVSASGQLSAGSSAAGGGANVDVTSIETIGSSVQAGALTGSSTTFDTYGRIVFTFNGPLPAGSPTQLVAYQIDPTNFFFMTLDPHGTTILLSGAAASSEVPSN